MDIFSNLSIIIPNHKERRLMEVYACCKKLFPQAQIILSDDLESKGKGYAIREGLKHATGDIICFLDGDMDIHPIELFKLLNEVDEYSIVIGNRFYRASISRRILNLGYKFLLWLLFGFSFSIDTQAGIKVFHRYVLSNWQTDSFAFDIEILAKAIKTGYRVKQVPVISEIRRTKNIKVIWNTFIETIKVRQRI